MFKIILNCIFQIFPLGPPQPGLFLLPGSGPPAPPPSATPTSLKSGPRSRYVPPPGIHTTSSSGNIPFMMEHSTPIMVILEYQVPMGSI